jgi:hypothetical protein
MSTHLIMSLYDRINNLSKTVLPVLIITSLLGLYAQATMAEDVAFEGSETDVARKVQNVLSKLSAKAFEFEKDAAQRQRFDAFVKGLGFGSVDDLLNATVGSAVPIFSIHLRRLQAIQNERSVEPWSLLTQTHGAFVPISIKQKIKSAVTVSVDSSSHAPNAFVTVDILGSRAGRMVFAEIEARPCKCFAIVVNALDRHFLGEGSRTQPSFNVRVLEDGPGNLKKGEVRDARDVLVELSTEAKNRKKYDMPKEP